MKINEYYKNYLALHQNTSCRRFHVVGNIVSFIFVVYCVISQKWLFVLAAPFLVYPFAWLGHFLFEKNTPAAWSNPIKAKVCDWLMLKDIVTGKIKW